MLVNTTPLVHEFSTNFNSNADGVRSSGSWVPETLLVVRQSRRLQTGYTFALKAQIVKW